MKIAYTFIRSDFQGSVGADTLSCKSTGYRRTTKECFISSTPAFAALNETIDPSSTVFAFDDWTLVFRGTPGIGTNPKLAWIGTEGVTSTDETCMSLSATSCRQHYRDPVVDQWDNLRITEVKISFYKDDNEKYIIFNGTDTTISDWFQKERILSSSWSGMEQKSFTYFSLEGHASRNFFTSSYYGCDHDEIFTLVLTSHVLLCTYDIHTTYPQFLFATENAAGRPESLSGVAFADVFAIFVK
ncbi:hypothetical protein DPMN_099554 [Dreissena polymorpha]|uniref:Uncharacterized protein n=1 Tax=Dreissena polymorpha TaxID=45954 RepID=A0A9D4LEB4_DREPO|nr:hypothetical protein DPMN_099554 [Dreissena polymorpha]